MKLALKCSARVVGFSPIQLVAEIEAHRFAPGIDFDVERLALHPGPGPTLRRPERRPSGSHAHLAFRRRLPHAEIKLLAAIPHDVAVVRVGPAVSTDIDIAGIGAVTGVRGAVSPPGWCPSDRGNTSGRGRIRPGNRWRSRRNRPQCRGSRSPSSSSRTSRCGNDSVQAMIRDGTRSWSATWF